MSKITHYFRHNTTANNRDAMSWLIVFLNVAALVTVKSEVLSAEIATETPVKDGQLCNESSFANIVCRNNKLIFCGPHNEMISTPCMVHGRQGFCNCEKDGCVAEKPVCTNEKPMCYEPNTKLPDHQDCHKFSYCNSKSEKITLKCPGNLIYDPNSGQCVDRRTVRCSRIVCPKPGKTLQLIPFPQAKNFYVLCYQGSGDVRKCPLKNYAVNDNKCQYDCNTAGTFQDTNETKCNQGIYYICVKARNGFTTIQAKCPEGMTLNENLKICTSDQNCKMQSKALVN